MRSAWERQLCRPFMPAFPRRCPVLWEGHCGLLCNPRDVAHSPPIDWPIDRKRVYFNWGRQVLDRLRGVCPQLEALFDQAMALRT